MEVALSAQVVLRRSPEDGEMTTKSEQTANIGAPVDETAQAAKAIELLQAYLEGHDDAMSSLQLCASHEPGQTGGPMISLPATAIGFLREILAELAVGNAVTVAPVHSYVTTQQAAELLNVSRPFLVGLLDDRAIPHKRVGNRRRIRLDDVLAYKQRDEIHRQRLLDELTAQAEDLGLEY